jgi:hypothetical protein
MTFPARFSISMFGCSAAQPAREREGRSFFPLRCSTVGASLVVLWLRKIAQQTFGSPVSLGNNRARVGPLSHVVSNMAQLVLTKWTKTRQILGIWKWESPKKGQTQQLREVKTWETPCTRRNGLHRRWLPSVGGLQVSCLGRYRT